MKDESTHPVTHIEEKFRKFPRLTPKIYGKQTPFFQKNSPPESKNTEYSTFQEIMKNNSNSVFHFRSGLRLFLHSRILGVFGTNFLGKF